MKVVDLFKKNFSNSNKNLGRISALGAESIHESYRIYTGKAIPEIIYTVLGGTLNPTRSLTYRISWIFGRLPGGNLGQQIGRPMYSLDALSW